MKCLPQRSGTYIIAIWYYNKSSTLKPVYTIAMRINELTEIFTCFIFQYNVLDGLSLAFYGMRQLSTLLFYFVLSGPWFSCLFFCIQYRAVVTHPSPSWSKDNIALKQGNMGSIMFTFHTCASQWLASCSNVSMWSKEVDVEITCSTVLQHSVLKHALSLNQKLLPTELAGQPPPRIVFSMSATQMGIQPERSIPKVFLL